MIEKKLKHLALIMDWNRRWAKARFMPAIAWHKAWADNVVKIAELANAKWITHLTLWALSTENLQKRSDDEVTGIIKLVNSIESYLDRMNIEWLRFNTIWDISRLPEESQEVLQRVVKNTENNSGITLTIALIYWGQDEIVRATKKIILEWQDPNNLSQEKFRRYLDTADLPVPDVIARTGGDMRHSWFLLYDSAYSEYYFTNKKWPEFDESELDNVIEFFNNSKRNFWK
jgi:undecaprenyl diphosphate synthase